MTTPGDWPGDRTDRMSFLRVPSHVIPFYGVVQPNLWPNNAYLTALIIVVSRRVNYHSSDNNAT